MRAATERRLLMRASWFAAMALLLPGCSIWQVGDVPPNFVDGSSHRGVEVIVFDNDSTTLASSGWDGEIALWTVGKNKPERVWQAHRGSAQGLVFAGDQLISGGQDGRLTAWARSGQAIHSVDTGSAITHVQVLGARVFTGHYDGSVRAWTLPGFDQVMHLDLHRGNLVLDLVVDADSLQIASSGYDGKVFIIDGAGHYRELRRPPMDAISLSFTPGGKTLYGGAWGRLYRWDLSGNGFESHSTPHWGAIAALQYLPTENVLASISRVNDSSVYFLDPATGQGVRHFQRQSICGTDVRVSPDGRYMAAGGDDGIVRIWDLAVPGNQ